MSFLFENENKREARSWLLFIIRIIYILLVIVIDILIFNYVKNEFMSMVSASLFTVIFIAFIEAGISHYKSNDRFGNIQ